VRKSKRSRVSLLPRRGFLFRDLNPKKDESEDPIAFALMKVRRSLQERSTKNQDFPGLCRSPCDNWKFNLFAAFQAIAGRTTKTSVAKLGSITNNAMEPLLPGHQQHRTKRSSLIRLSGSSFPWLTPVYGKSLGNFQVAMAVKTL